MASRKVDLKEPSSADRANEPDDADEDARFRAKVLRDFFVDGRLKEIPAQRKRRVVVLQHLTTQFDLGRSYTEREVNEVLKAFHADVATLRRELIDYGCMSRERGIYQVTRGAPERSRQVRQEIIGDESEWFRSLVTRAIDISKDQK